MVRIIYPRTELGEGKYNTVCTVCYEEELIVFLFMGVLRSWLFWNFSSRLFFDPLTERQKSIKGR